MKKLSLILIVTFLIGEIVVFGAKYKYEGSVSLGYNVVGEDNMQIKNYPLLRLGFEADDVLLDSLRPAVTFSFANVTYDNDRSSSVYRLALEEIYELPDRRYLTPFLKGGVGFETIERSQETRNENGVYLLAGGGVKVHLKKRFDFIAQGEYLLKNNAARFDNNYVLLVGISYKFAYNEPSMRVISSGIVEKVKKKKQKTKTQTNMFQDSDKDGVLDSKDRCPNTPTGVKIDAFGCELDDDGDGIANSKDVCPNTPKGAKVDTRGCALDKDGDGVLNTLDKCPNTPKGVEVDANGCKIQAIIALVRGKKAKSAIVVSTPGGSVEVDRFDTLTTISDPQLPPASPKPVSPQTLAKLFPSVAASSAKPPRSYTIYFSGLKIRPQSRQTLQRLIADVKERKGESIRITGYTDTVGAAASNYAYGLKRAQVIQRYVEKENGDATIEIRSFGEDVLAVPTPDNVDEDKNKRVEVFVY